MRIAGIIAEYNPFHTGHAFHIARTRQESSCDYVVACMSGSFTQRGDAACLRARERARAALLNGVDAVVELPVISTVRTADAFARGGVTILDAIGCDVLSFGCETNDAELLKRLAELRISEPEAVSDMIRSNLERGESHARARGRAVADFLGIDPAQLNAPNLILGSEYIASIKKLGSRMEILPILRSGCYHDTCLRDFASASAIRAALANGQEEALAYVPVEEAEALQRERMHPMDDILLYRLRSMTDTEYADLPDIAEGLDKRIRNATNFCASREELLMSVKCKRYTLARISRACTQALLGMDRRLIETHSEPEYIRLVGVRRDAMPLLKELKSRSKLPIISNVGDLKNDPVFRLDARADDIRSLLCENDRQTGKLFTDKFLVV